MLPTRLTILAAIAVAASLTLAACGGDDGGDDEAEITDVIQTSATSNDPANCTEIQTQAFNEQLEFATGEEAIASCEEAEENDTADEVEVTNISVDGDTATAEASPVGGNLDGQTIQVSLVNEDDQWKLDSFDEFVEFDKETFIAGFVEELSADPDVPAEVTGCVEDQMTAADEATIQDVFLSGDPAQLSEIFGTCFGTA